MKKSNHIKIAILVLGVFVNNHVTGNQIPLNTPVEFKVGIKSAIALTFPTEIEKFYQVQVSTNLIDWDNEGYSFQGTGGMITKYASTRDLSSAFFMVHDGGSSSNLAPPNICHLDQTIYEGTIVTNWSTIDLAPYIGSGFKICLFEITKTSGSVAFDIKLLPNGKEYPTPPWDYGTGFYAFGTGAGSFTNAGKENNPLRIYLICHTDEDGKIIWQTNGQGAEITIKLTAVL